LTGFQRETERRLAGALGRLGLVLADRILEGDIEPFVQASVGDVRIWIYSDEACVIGRGVDRVYERWDFASPEALATAFIEQVVSLFS